MVEVVNPRRLNVFVTFMIKESNALNTNQNAVEKKFIKLGESWNDNVYNITGDKLLQTAKFIEKLYLTLSDSIKAAVQYHNKFMELEGYSETLNAARISDFKTIFRSDNFMHENYNKNNVIDIDAMRGFTKALGDYCVETRKIVNELKNEYNAMGRDNAWKAKQYDRLGEIIYGIGGKIDVQLNDLEICKRMIEIKLKKYEELRNINI